MISFYCATYNRADYLGLALSSFLQQTDKDFEIVILDDGSTDNTPKILEYWTRRLPLRTIRVDRRKGECWLNPSPVLNVVMRALHGEIACNWGPDTIISPDTVAKHKAVHANGKNFYVTSRRGMIDRFEDHSFMPASIAEAKNRAKWSWPKIKNEVPYTVHVWSIPTKTLQEIRGYDERFRGYAGAEHELWHRLKRSGVKIKETDAWTIHLWHPRPEKMPSVKREKWNPNAPIVANDENWGTLKND